MIAFAGPHWLAWRDLTRPESELLRRLSAGSGSLAGRGRKPQAHFRDRLPETIALRACFNIVDSGGGHGKCQ
jgi:hypothetical protein